MASRQFEKGRCTRGAGCPFAHGEQELGTLNPRVRSPLAGSRKNENLTANGINLMSLLCGEPWNHQLQPASPACQRLPRPHGFQKCPASSTPSGGNKATKLLRMTRLPHDAHTLGQHVDNPQQTSAKPAQAAVQLTHWVDPAPAPPGQHVRALAVSPEPTDEDCKRYKRRLCTFYEEVWPHAQA